MQPRRLVAALLMTGFTLFWNGCVTHSLWTGDLVETFHQPCAPNGLALFKATDGRIIVQYDETSPWGNSVTRRTYLLSENEWSIQARHKPHFMAVDVVANAVKIPTVRIGEPAPVRLTNGDYATTTADGNLFTIYYSNRAPDGPYQLPGYRGATGNLKMIGLTPITVTIDLTIIAGFLGLWGLYLWAASGAGPVWGCH